MQRLILPLLLLIIVSCSETNESTPVDINENDLGIISASVFSDDTNLDGKALYDTATPGHSAKYERAFENAPPMIPHNTEGFFPITMKSNICLSCHMPAVAEAAGAVALPETHFTSLRPAITMEDGIYKTDVGGAEIVKRRTPETLSNLYFSCNQCHAPQATITVDIENLFTPEFRELLNKNRSTLDDQVTEGIR